MKTYLLAFYELDMAYGGPEEGGWYYPTGELSFPNGEKRRQGLRLVP